VGDDIESAIAFAVALGPAAEVVRLAGEDAANVKPQIEADLRELAAEYQQPGGIIAEASCWVVTATA
jgi:hypothetical protein